MNDTQLAEWLCTAGFPAPPIPGDCTIADATTLLVKLLSASGANAELMAQVDFTALELAANPTCLRLLKGVPHA